MQRHTASLERALRALASDFRRIADRSMFCALHRNLPFLRATPRGISTWCVDCDSIDRIRWVTDPGWNPEHPTYVEYLHARRSHKEEAWQLVIGYEGHLYDEAPPECRADLDRECKQHHSKLSKLGCDTCRIISNVGLRIPGHGTVLNWDEGSLFDWLWFVFQAAWSGELAPALTARKYWPAHPVAQWILQKYYAPFEDGYRELASFNLARILEKNEQKRLLDGEYSSWLEVDPCNASSLLLDYLADQLHKDPPSTGHTGFAPIALYTRLGVSRNTLSGYRKTAGFTPLKAGEVYTPAEAVAVCRLFKNKVGGAVGDRAGEIIEECTNTAQRAQIPPI